MEKKYDFIAIGDIVTDAFIELDEAELSGSPDTEDYKICISFGDKVPYKDVVIVPAVGNSPNASVSATRLGLKTALVTNLGDDKFGKEDLEALEKNAVDTSFVKVHEGMKSNYHYVLRFGAERTILIKHQEYPYSMPDIGSPKWLYLSSLGENSLPFHSEIAKYLTEHPEIKLAFQPGTFQMKLGYEKLTDIYKLSELFFCNKEEAKRILKSDEDKIEKLLEMMRDLGPKIIVITDGPNGAYTYDGKEIWHMPIYPDPAKPVDRTGAGDSFSSTFTSFLALGNTIPEALERAPINSMSVVQHIGAQEGLLTNDQLEDYLTKAPENYKAKKLR